MSSFLQRCDNWINRTFGLDAGTNYARTQSDQPAPQKGPIVAHGPWHPVIPDGSGRVADLDDAGFMEIKKDVKIRLMEIELPREVFRSYLKTMAFHKDFRDTIIDSQSIIALRSIHESPYVSTHAELSTYLDDHIMNRKMGEVIDYDPGITAWSIHMALARQETRLVVQTCLAEHIRDLTAECGSPVLEYFFTIVDGRAVANTSNSSEDVRNALRFLLGQWPGALDSNARSAWMERFMPCYLREDLPESLRDLFDHYHDQVILKELVLMKPFYTVWRSHFGTKDSAQSFYDRVMDKIKSIVGEEPVQVLMAPEYHICPTPYESADLPYYTPCGASRLRASLLRKS